MSTKAVSLTRHLLDHEAREPELGVEFCHLMAQLAFAAKIMAREIARAPLVDMLGLSGEHNATGDAQKKLDIFTNDTMVDAFAHTGLVAEIISEEMEELNRVPGGANAHFVLCVNPLDGSSNTDTNGPVGTIFGVYRRRDDSPEGHFSKVLRRGSEQVAAGYVMYGPGALLVYSSGSGVTGFTLDPNLGEFILSHPDIRCPVRGRLFSANLGNFYQWNPNIRKYVEYLTTNDGSPGRPYSLRYTGALVADFHRSLISGGIFFYPSDAKHLNGKLRLLYECAPLALVIENAGGRASDGSRPILDIAIDEAHQATPLVIGSAEDVAMFEAFLRGGTPS
jgi:fructose-1,6-bisphosphatase I